MTQIAQKTLRDVLRGIEDAISKGRMDDAESKCQQILTQFPESLEAQRLLGEIFLAKGNLEEAQQAFDWVLTNDPENVIAYCDRALISERQGDYDTALDCYQQAYELSRGNSKIRQQFNKLSQKAGQQGFMLSRAGLARLYMRGDLLTQAIQEWEAVLAMAPDRLDARTGLLETYWREGLYERVEQLAGQVLKDVAGCEKALLLLAYVTSLKSTTQAQELIRRVEVLDPDLLMAQDLFSDLLASQPAEPFLDLLKKPPVLLTASKTSEPSIPPAAEAPQKEPALSGWEGLEQWSANTLGTEQKQESSTPLLSNWSESQGGESSIWSDFISTIPGESSKSVPEEGNSSAYPSPSQWEGTQWNGADQQERVEIKQPEAQGEPWEALQDALSKVNAEGGNLSSLSPDVWASLDQYLQQGGAREELRMPEESQPQDLAANSSPAQEHTGSSAPSWMSSLNQVERKQMSGSGNEEEQEHKNEKVSLNGNKTSASSTWSSPQQSEATPGALVPPPAPQKETNKGQSSWSPEPESAASVGKNPPASSEEEEDSFFGPAWLRSLGAAGIEEQPTEDKDKTIVPESAAAQKAALPPYEVWSPPQQQPEEASPWMDMTNQPAQQARAEEEERRTVQEEPTWVSSLQPGAEDQGHASKQEPTWMDSLRQSSEPGWLSSLQQPSGPTWMDALQQEAKTDSPLPAEEKGKSERDESYTWSTALDAVPETDWRSSYTPGYNPESSWGQVEQILPDTLDAQNDPLMATLRELEQGLLAQGFVPMEPNSLSSLAQAEQRVQAEPAEPVSPAGEPSLSSALAELGGFGTLPTNPTKEPTPPSRASTPPSSMPLPQRNREEQVPARQTEPVPQKAPFQPQMPAAEARNIPTSTPIPGAQPAASTSMPRTRPTTSDQRASEAPVREESVRGLNFRPSPASSATNASIVHIDPLLDSELETTMKRPAIRIQPARGGVAKEPPTPYVKPRSGERSTLGRVSEQGMSNQERLIAGYQHQLVGDYDEAMQEYRLIIRGAPDLLGEVVSNVRALLKLAPKYAAGYRVLGDAYMRQGEYLQAMEAYNKALTMAKKK